MTSNMPTEDSSPGLARTLLCLLQSGGANVFHSNQLRPEVLVDGMKNKLLGGYNDFQHAVSRYIHHAAPTTGTPESVDLESILDSNQQVTNTGRGHPFHNHNNSFTSEADDSDVGAGQRVASGEYSSDGAPLGRSKRSCMWLAAFLVAVLSVIVLPGLVVGVMTGQMSWGVELSGAIAPIVSLLAGLYYHHHK